MWSDGDWACRHFGSHNFHHRTTCLACDAVRKHAVLQDLAKVLARSQASKALAKRTQEEQGADEVTSRGLNLQLCMVIHGDVL